MPATRWGRLAWEFDSPGSRYTGRLLTMPTRPRNAQISAKWKCPVDKLR